jgi:nitroreductase
MASNLDYDKVASDLRRTEAEHTRGALDARELVRQATLAASSHNTQPWKFRIEQDRIVILPDFSRRCPVVDADDSHLFKSLGCAAENIVHAAAAQGFSADVRFDAAADGIVVLLNRDATARATDLSRAIPGRQCVKATYDGTPVDSAEIDVLVDAGRRASVRTIVLTSDAQKDAVADYVNRGNAVQLTDPAFRDELVSWIRFNPAQALRSGDGLAGRTSGQPPLPGWVAKAIVGLVITPKAQAKSDAGGIASAAGVAVFVSSRDDKAAWVDVGRAYERFALQATVLGIRSAFINQPIEVRELRPELESWLGLEGEHALLMVRFGHGPTAPFSLRRPLDEVIV